MKTWFLSALGKALAKSRMRELCKLMELSDMETRLILARFCDCKTMLQCDDILSEHNQKQLIPDLDAKVKGWVTTHYKQVFGWGEMESIIRVLNKKIPLSPGG